MDGAFFTDTRLLRWSSWIAKMTCSDESSRDKGTPFGMETTEADENNATPSRQHQNAVA